MEQERTIEVFRNQMNDLVGALRERDQVVDKNISALNNRITRHREELDAQSSRILELEEKVVLQQGLIESLQDSMCRCGENGSSQVCALTFL